MSALATLALRRERLSALLAEHAGDALPDTLSHPPRLIVLMDDRGEAFAFGEETYRDASQAAEGDVLDAGRTPLGLWDLDASTFDVREPTARATTRVIVTWEPIR
jgi:hypothetical protein